MAFFISSPFDALVEFQRSLDAFRDSSWLDSFSGGGAFPPLNVFSKGDDIVIVTEAPGVHKADLRIEVKENAVRIAGKKDASYGGDRVSLHRRERPFGSFDRTVSLPVEVDPDRVKAELRDGILALYLPRAERSKPKTINIA